MKTSIPSPNRNVRNGGFTAEKLRKAGESLYRKIPIERLKEYFEEDETTRK